MSAGDGPTRNANCLSLRRASQAGSRPAASKGPSRRSRVPQPGLSAARVCPPRTHRHTLPHAHTSPQCAHTHARTCTHTRPGAHRHTLTRTHVPAVCTHACPHMHTHTRPGAHAHTHTRTHVPAWAHTLVHISRQSRPQRDQRQLTASPRCATLRLCLHCARDPRGLGRFAPWGSDAPFPAPSGDSHSPVRREQRTRGALGADSALWSLVVWPPARGSRSAPRIRAPSAPSSQGPGHEGPAALARRLLEDGGGGHVISCFIRYYTSPDAPHGDSTFMHLVTRSPQ